MVSRGGVDAVIEIHKAEVSSPGGGNVSFSITW
jgi:hypothetical protein